MKEAGVIKMENQNEIGTFLTDLVDFFWYLIRKSENYKGPQSQELYNSSRVR